MKTVKSIAKRFKITRRGKVLRRALGQDHFNARESGNTTRYKRRDQQVRQATVARTIKKAII